VAFASENLVSGQCLNEIETLKVPLAASKSFDLEVKDRSTGLPVDFTAGGTVDPSRLTAKLTAVHVWGSTEVVFSVAGTVISATVGLVNIILTELDTGRPGVFTATLGVFVDTTLTYTQPFFIEIEPNDLYQNFGPPTIAEIRLHLRDTCPESNFLLDETEFSDSEIASALRLPIDMFNEIPPPLGTMFNVDSFPYRYHWMVATIGLLHRIAASHYRRNKLAYSTGGTSIDPQADKAQEYEAIAERRMAEYREWMQIKKIELNVDAGFGTTQSPYAFIWGTNG